MVFNHIISLGEMDLALLKKISILLKSFKQSFSAGNPGSSMGCDLDSTDSSSNLFMNLLLQCQIGT